MLSDIIKQVVSHFAGPQIDPGPDAIDIELDQRRKALAVRQDKLRQQMLEDGTHLFCGRLYSPSAQGSVILLPYIQRNMTRGL